MDGKEIGIIEGKQQCVFVHVQQVFIGSDEQRDSRQRGLSQDFSVVLFGFGN
jgi:hypothetical protein